MRSRCRGSDIDDRSFISRHETILVMFAFFDPIKIKQDQAEPSLLLQRKLDYVFFFRSQGANFIALVSVSSTAPICHVFRPHQDQKHRAESTYFNFFPSFDVYVS